VVILGAVIFLHKNLFALYKIMYTSLFVEFSKNREATPLLKREIFDPWGRGVV